MPPVVVPSAAGMVASRFAFVPSGFGIRRDSMPAAWRRASTWSMSGRFVSRLVVSNVMRFVISVMVAFGGCRWHVCS